MGTLYIKNKICPFCGRKLINNSVNCNQYISLPCLECKECKVYLYTETDYNILKELASNRNRRLNHDVYKYQEIEQKDIYKLSKTNIKSKKKNKKILTKCNNTKLKHKTSKIINSVPFEKIRLPKIAIDYNIVRKCSYFKNNTCIYFDNLCNPYSIKCKNRGILALLNNTDFLKKQGKIKYDKKQNKTSFQQFGYVKSVVLSHNKKCIFEEHNIVDVNAKFKLLISNKIIETSILAGYCEVCKQYIILKSDFKSIKQKGTLLCQVIDKTPEYLAKHKDTYSATESRVHSLGYNVIKQRYNYTFEQRKIILANIIENYSITQHEILSMLDTNISRKINLPNYADAVAKWQQDREFVANYNSGDIPEVIINEIVVGSRK